LATASATQTWDRYGHLYGDRLDVVADAMDAKRAAALASVGTRLVPDQVETDMK
jgi:hypothetical protein